MLKFRRILRENLVARFFVQLFIFNFFTCQCFAMMPSEMVVKNTKSLFTLLDSQRDEVRLVLTKKRGVFNLDIHQINEFDTSVAIHIKNIYIANKANAL